MKALQKIFWGLLFVMGAILTVNALTYLNFDPAYKFLSLKQAAVASGWYLPFYYMHIFVGGLILLVGFLQVSRWVRQKFKRLHRWAGYFYVFGILFFSAPGGLGMSFFVDRGWAVLVSFLMQCGLWFYCTWMAFVKIKKREVAAHELWMWRSFSLTLAAITLRLYIFFSVGHFNLAQPGAYAIIAWASWLPNILLVELFRGSAAQKLKALLTTFFSPAK